MLNILNNLEPFIEDCYRRFSVREYAKLIKTRSNHNKDILAKTAKKSSF